VGVWACGRVGVWACGRVSGREWTWWTGSRRRGWGEAADERELPPSQGLRRGGGDEADERELVPTGCIFSCGEAQWN
jgi:hypothetical protein